MGKRLHNVFASLLTSALHLLILGMLQHAINERHDFTHVRLTDAVSETMGLPIRIPLATAGGFSIVGNGILVDDNPSDIPGRHRLLCL